MVKKTDNMPWWVLLAFASIPSRKAALWLITASLLFTVYCVPWVFFIDHALVSALFLITDWSWVAMMVPIVIWYCLSLRWVDRYGGWEA